MNFDITVCMVPSTFIENIIVHQYPYYYYYWRIIFAYIVFDPTSKHLHNIDNWIHHWLEYCIIGLFATDVFLIFLITQLISKYKYKFVACLIQKLVDLPTNLLPSFFYATFWIVHSISWLISWTARLCIARSVSVWVSLPG